jgi:pimeloyl-ACP methyl ester carboxylesterase
MEFIPKQKPVNKKKFLKYFGIGIISCIILAVFALEMFSIISISNFEDLDIKAETARLGGSFYEKDGDKMYYAEYGQKDGEVVFLLHDYNGGGFTWHNNLDLGQKYHLYMIDLLGFGLSKDIKSKDIGLDRDVEILSSLIQDKKLSNINLVGHGMGGVVAQKLALKNQNSVKSLILINSLDASQSQNIPQLDNIPSFPLLKNPLGLYKYSTGINSYLAKSFYDDSLIDKKTLEGYQKVFRYKGSLDRLVQFSESSKYAKEDLSNIKIPTLVYVSENDEIIDPKTSIDLSKEILNNKLIKVPKSGHALNEEQYNLVNIEIDKWIEYANEIRSLG